MAKNDGQVSTAVIGCSTVMLIFILSIPISAFVGMFVGWIASWTIGNMLCESLNMLFKSSFKPENLPMLFFGLGAIGAMFRSTTTTNTNK